MTGYYLYLILNILCTYIFNDKYPNGYPDESVHDGVSCYIYFNSMCLVINKKYIILLRRKTINMLYLYGKCMSYSTKRKYNNIHVRITT